MGYMLITVRKILHVEIITESFNTREDAFNKMKAALSDRLKVDGDEDLINSLEAGVELSNAVLNDNDAYIYQDSGETYHHWKIVQVSIAYDIDKVVEELEELEEKAVTRYKGGNFGDYDGVDYYIKKSEAIEIVNQGGVSDDV